MTLTELKEWKSTIITEIERFNVDKETVMNELLNNYEDIVDADDDGIELFERLDVIITKVLVNGPKIDLGEVNRERERKNLGSKWAY